MTIGSLHHWTTHRNEYLTRQQAADRIHTTRKTIERYINDGLPTYNIGARRFVHVDELLAKYRAKLLANPNRRP